MAAFLSCSVSGRWEELPILMPLEGQKWHFRPLVSFILSYLLFDGAYVGNVAQKWLKNSKMETVRISWQIATTSC